jgi:hypothetical protein
MMETTSNFSISEVSESGKLYSGSFTVKNTLSRRDRFLADQYRREIIGPSPEGSMVPPDLQLEAHMLGQLRVRITKCPDWWTNSNFGLELDDSDIITKLFALSLKEEARVRIELKKEAEQALEKLSKEPAE